LLNTPSQFLNTFTGTVENFDGSLLGDMFAQPPAFSGPNGVYFLSSKTPLVLSGDVFNPPTSSSVFLGILGRAPNEGEQVTTLDALTQTYTTTTFINGAWNNGDPTLAIGEAAMINIGPVPEPSPLALLAAGLGLLGAVAAFHAPRSPRPLSTFNPRVPASVSCPTLRYSPDVERENAAVIGENGGAVFQFQRNPPQLRDGSQAKFVPFS
jgi:hypothetical protein